MTEYDDPLWNPELLPDEDLARIQRVLAPYRAGTQVQAMPPHVLPRSSGRRSRRHLGWATAAILAIVLVGGHHYRLAWPQGEGWVVTQVAAGEHSQARMGLGQGVVTSDGVTALIDVARIGNLTLSPRSRLRLVETATGRHSVALEYGHLRARIWAPPGHFRVGTGAGEVVDLGCDFELWQEPEGTGRVLVRSGWVSYRVGSEDILVAEGHTMVFAGEVAGTPMRNDAPPELVEAVLALEAALRQDDAGDGTRLEQAAQRVAINARDADAFTLLSVLTRWPGLARTVLYERLATALGQPAGEAHRAAWEAGHQPAMTLWWDTLPRQPKQWWGGWKDLL